MINRKKVKNSFVHILSVLSLTISIFAFFTYISNNVSCNLGSLGVFAASFVVPGDFTQTDTQSDFTCPGIISLSSHSDSNVTNIFSDSSIDAIVQDTPKFEIPHESGEETYKIVECFFGANGSKLENFFINNKTKLDVDFAGALNEKPDIPIKKDGTPEVLIVHTHTTEAYMDKDQGFYYQSFHARSLDPKYNVVQVGNAICKSLENAGVKTIHDTTCHDDPTYSGSYSRCAETIDKNLNNYPSIKVVLDIHRDTIENKEKRKIKPTFTVNNKKAAQIMIISGCDDDGTLNHPEWIYNLRFALKLNKQIETMYPGMTRALLFKHARYNMHKSHGSLLIEVGSDANTLDEAVYSGALLGRSLAEVLNNLM